MERRLIQKVPIRLRPFGTTDIYRDTMCQNKGHSSKCTGIFLKPRSHRFFLETKLLRTIRNGGTLHFSIRNEKIVRGGIQETIGLAVARHRLGYHHVHVKSTEERFEFSDGLSVCSSSDHFSITLALKARYGISRGTFAGSCLHCPLGKNYSDRV